MFTWSYLSNTGHIITHHLHLEHVQVCPKSLKMGKLCQRFPEPDQKAERWHVKRSLNSSSGVSPWSLGSLLMHVYAENFEQSHRNVEIHNHHRQCWDNPQGSPTNLLSVGDSWHVWGHGSLTDGCTHSTKSSASSFATWLEVDADTVHHVVSDCAA